MGYEGVTHLTLFGRLNPVVKSNDRRHVSPGIRCLQAVGEHIGKIQKRPTRQASTLCRDVSANKKTVAVRLAGDSALENATAGKPDCYGFVSLIRALLPGRRITDQPALHPFDAHLDNHLALAFGLDALGDQR
jgi:hypothetical protein